MNSRLMELLFRELAKRRYASPPMVGEETMELAPRLNLDAEQLVNPDTGEIEPMYDWSEYK